MFRDFRESSTLEQFRPYVNRALKDDQVRKSVTRAASAAKRVYDELAGEDALGVARKFAQADEVREDLDHTVQNLSEALLRVSGKTKRRPRAWKPLLLAAVVAAVLFNPVTGEATRRWIKDNLFGSEEEFDYSRDS